MAHYEHRLPDNIERRVLGGPKFRTQFATATSGREKRNIDWSLVRYQGDLSSAIKPWKDLDALRTVLDLFHVQEGMGHTFRFKVFADFTIGDFDNPTTDNQSIGTGDGAQKIFQVFQRYSFGVGVPYDRDRTKLVAGRTAFLLDNVVEATPADYTVDLDTGLATWVVAPPGGVDVQVACDYDIPTRFGIDWLQVATDVNVKDLRQLPKIPINEVLPGD